MDRYEILIKANENFLEDRPTMKEANSDPELLLHLLLNETDEFAQAFMLHLRGETDRKDVLQELSDIMLFALTLYAHLDADMFAEVMEKVAFNILRYEPVLFANGKTFEEARQEVKRREKKHNMREEFYGDT